MRLLRNLKRVRMAAVHGANAQQQAAETSGGVPWWIQYTRWRPTSYQEAKAAERKLLGLCSTQLEVSDVSLGAGKHDSMHTIFGGPPSGTPLVCLPGYGAGAAFYFRNIDGLAQQFRLHLVDLLGTGMSGRPRFTAKTRQEAEDFFLDALAKWREELGLGKMILVGHSLGGYLAATYALRHPEHVEHLVLVCPAGMSTPPDPTATPEWAKNPWSWRGQLYRLSRTLWDRGVTPGSVIRTLGPMGPRLIHGYARNRFREGMGLSEEEVSAFEDYFFHITAAKGSGEHALSHLLGPFAWARHPLEGRLHELKVPCSLIYGESDWMDPRAGQRIFDSMLQERGKLSSSDLQFDVIPGAGHYPFLDQPELFLQKLLKQTHPYLAKRGAEAAQKAVWGLEEADARASEAMQRRKADGTDARQFDL